MNLLPRCQSYHVCASDGRDGLLEYSFLCPNGTIFNQQYFICDWWFNVDCSQVRQKKRKVSAALYWVTCVVLFSDRATLGRALPAIFPGFLHRESLSAARYDWHVWLRSWCYDSCLLGQTISNDFIVSWDLLYRPRNFTVSILRLMLQWRLRKLTFKDLALTL